MTVLLLLLGQEGLQALLNALQHGPSLASVAPWAIAIAVVAAIQSFVAAVQRERHIGCRQSNRVGVAAKLDLGAVEVQV
jgi:hypothetical protein